MMTLREKSAFTLIELVMVIVVIGILSAFAAPKIIDTIKQSRIQGTKQELKNLKDAIVGDPESSIGGEIAEKGYYGDVGSLPPASSGASVLDALVNKPSSVSAWDRFDQTGWNGPYIDDEGTNEWRTDAWGNYYVYDANNGTITSYGPDESSGGGDDITIQLNK